MNSHKLTFGTPFSLGTLDTVTYAKYREKLQFISLFIKKINKGELRKRPPGVHKREEVMTDDQSKS